MLNGLEKSKWPLAQRQLQEAVSGSPVGCGSGFNISYIFYVSFRVHAMIAIDRFYLGLRAKQAELKTKTWERDKPKEAT